LAEGETLTPELLTAEIHLSKEAPASASLPPNATLAEVEKEHLVAVLNATGWHRSKAAQKLGISRRTLYNKMAEYVIEPPKI
jgi:DNA-binding NtrC family response regulator